MGGILAPIRKSKAIVKAKTSDTVVKRIFSSHECISHRDGRLNVGNIDTAGNKEWPFVNDGKLLSDADTPDKFASFEPL
jgi:hypothetical protein